jgi:hypothetical protein
MDSTYCTSAYARLTLFAIGGADLGIIYIYLVV